jgi:curved DNA-binding protein CbpA
VESFYDKLGVAPTASADEIKHAFRREIAKYHPDKVQHLGVEFQSMATAKAADLTAAHSILDDEFRRAEYDAQLRAAKVGAAVAPAAQPGASPPTPTRDAPGRPETRPRAAGGASSSPPGPQAGPSVPSSDRVGASSLVRKAAVMRFRAASIQAFGQCEDGPVRGFDVAFQPPKSGFFSRSRPPRILGRFVEMVDAVAVRDSWAWATRAKTDEQRDLCVFLMGPVLAPVAELSRAIAEQRRTGMPAGTLTMVPVNTSSWSAHVPNDAPAAARALISGLRAD